MSFSELQKSISHSQSAEMVVHHLKLFVEANEDPHTSVNLRTPGRDHCKCIVSALESHCSTL